MVAYEDVLVATYMYVRETASKNGVGWILAARLVDVVVYLVYSFVGRW